MVIIIMMILGMAIGYGKGFISSIIILAGLFITVLIIANFGPSLQARLVAWGTHPTFATILMAVSIFVIIAILCSIIKLLFNKITKLLKISFLNRVAGAVLGFSGVIVLWIMVLAILDLFPIFIRFHEYLYESTIIQEVARIYRFISATYSETIGAIGSAIENLIE
jgi:uncharacterized membrane protein required for colicin V production